MTEVEVRRRTCDDCRAHEHLRCVDEHCICVHRVHDAFARPDDRISRLPARIRGCMHLVTMDPGQAKAQLQEISELVEKMVNNAQTMRWLFSELWATGDDIASRLSVDTDERE